MENIIKLSGLNIVFFNLYWIVLYFVCPTQVLRNYRNIHLFEQGLHDFLAIRPKDADFLESSFGQ